MSGENESDNNFLSEFLSTKHRFSNMQWYLANARNTVHLAAFSPHPISRSVFSQFVHDTVKRAPQLIMTENITDDCHQTPGEAKLDDLWEYKKPETLKVNLSKQLQARSDVYGDSGKPAFHAWCVSSKNTDKRGMRSFIMMQSTHALMEGADMSRILRDRVADHLNQTVVDVNLSLFSRLGMNLTAPVLGMIHLIMSKFEKRQPADFRIYSISVRAEDIRREARRMDISKRALLFALVLFAMVRGDVPQKPKKRHLFAYSTLSARKLKLEDDAYLSMRMQLLPFNGPPVFENFAAKLAVALAAQDENEVFTQFLYNRILAIQRAIQRVLPSVYRGAFFGYAPYDIVLSLLPPVRPIKAFSAISEALIFGGSSTGTVPNCIFVPGKNEITLSFWADRQLLDGLPTLKQLLKQQGIGLTDWMDGAEP